MNERLIAILFLTFCLSCREKADTETPTDEPLPSSVSRSHKDTEPVLFSMMSPLRTGIKFINHLTETPDMNGFLQSRILPNLAQTTSVNDIGVDDFEQDGNLDLV
ncbi:hypothetical protein QQ020_23170 [Fulvivirgaceae bacterium BMA12]|uniref:Uncharacterized protein n=1 Tax=Agaribacillus aureus TaxID=3051825 RepID=A0ABT8LF67_9BACT|nr:hypothetical protein [Fulvivirgaceae bacterium BMA12]